MKNRSRIILTVALIVAAGTWLVAATDYGDRVAVGTYRLSQNGEDSKLVLRTNHTFYQDLRRQSGYQSVEGSWHHLGEGGVAFSKEFLPLAGVEMGPDGTAFAEIHKPLGIFVALEMRQYHVLWYGKQDPSSHTAEGTYVGDEPDVTATLSLKPDHTFSQTISRGSQTTQAKGSWKTDALGGIEFSREFLKTSGEPLQHGETASAINPQGSNLQIEIALSSRPAIYRKRLPSW
jgi:hypothetical protein